jgi:hypothetical protein
VAVVFSIARNAGGGAVRDLALNAVLLHKLARLGSCTVPVCRLTQKVELVVNPSVRSHLYQRYWCSSSLSLCLNGRKIFYPLRSHVV